MNEGWSLYSEQGTVNTYSTSFLSSATTNLLNVVSPNYEGWSLYSEQGTVLIEHLLYLILLLCQHQSQPHPPLSCQRGAWSNVNCEGEGMNNILFDFDKVDSDV